MTSRTTEAKVKSIRAQPGTTRCRVGDGDGDAAHKYTGRPPPMGVRSLLVDAMAAMSSCTDSGESRHSGGPTRSVWK